MSPRTRGRRVSSEARRGSLVVVGTGIRAARHTTVEARAEMERAGRLFYLVSDPVSQRWIRAVNPTAKSLDSCYRVGRPRMEAYERMIGRVLAAVRAGARVCVVFYGHPGVFVFPSHEMIRRARVEGFDARMLPGISAEDCLFAELGVDPARSGCQSFEATDLLLFRRRFDPSCALVLWQAGVIGNLTYGPRPGRSGLRALSRYLERAYGRGHEVVLYEASRLPIFESEIRSTTIGRLPSEAVGSSTTIFVPPIPRPTDPRGLRQLRVPRSALTPVPPCWSPGGKSPAPLP